LSGTNVTIVPFFKSQLLSGSLLINIGSSVAKHIKNENNIKYYAQELKESTYNLTRMNLVMRGILPDNIVVRNGDTLEDDWPFFDESNPEETYEPLYVDAVVSNPPYSQAWDSTDKENDPRYARFGLAPKTKADYAFLLHALYHLKPNGIMTIVLPHGVLFRGGEEGEIRKNLIERSHRSDDEEFLIPFGHEFKIKENFMTHAQEYNDYRNKSRSHSGH
jgi:type I restriction enzyme M protein